MANSVDPDQTAPKVQSDQGLHCLLFHLHLLDALLYGEPHSSNFRKITAIFGVSQFFRFLRYSSDADI